MEKLLSGFTTNGNGSIDYVNGIRKFLLELSSRSSGSLSASASTFRPRPENHARELGSKHPWEFDYKRFQNVVVHESHPAHKKPEEIPPTAADLYWQQACNNPRRDVKVLLTQPARGKRIYASELIKQRYTAEDVHQFFRYIDEPKTLYAIRVMYKAIGSDSNWSRMRKEFKKVAEAPRSNSIATSIDVTVENFFNVIHEVGLKVTKSNVFSVAHAFRGLGMPEVIRVDEMYAAMKLLDEDDKRKGYTIEEDGDLLLDL